MRRRLSYLIGATLSVGLVFLMANSAAKADPGDTDPPALVVRNVDGSPVGPLDSIDFGETVPGLTLRLSITIENTSGNPIEGVSASIQGGHSADFALQGLSGDSIPPSGSIVATISFRPGGQGTRSSSLIITTGSGDPSVTVPVQGKGGTVFSNWIESPSSNQLFSGSSISGYTFGTIQLNFHRWSGNPSSC